MTRTGYVPGVYDLFHAGHLTLLRRSRRGCDRLIVGVVTDEVVEQVKGRRPVVPLDERMEIVRAIRFVDAVVVDPHRDKFDTWREIRYDILFKGDDWKGTPKGDKIESDLAGVGARVVYFPYTSHTSTSALRLMIDPGVGPGARPAGARTPVRAAWHGG
jgi:glycerol-3-phosphate cytidylyltransferase